MKVQANMRLLDREDLFAVGSVTINGIFTIHDVRVVKLAQKDGSELLESFLPRKKEGEEWRSVFQVSRELKKEIDAAIGKSLKNAICTDMFEDDLEVSVKPYRRGDLLGYATLNYAGVFKIENVRIYKAKEGDGVRLVYPYNRQEEQYQPLLDVNGRFADGDITQMVKEAYEEQMRRREPERKEAAR